MSRRRWLGGAALVAWGVHAAGIVARGEAWDLLWMCNVAGLGVAIGAFTGSARVLSVAAAWLTLGVPLWALDGAANGVRADSVAAHLGGLGLAWLGVRGFGWARGSAAHATAGLAVLMAISSVTTPATANVNLVAAVWPGWQAWFGGHAVYLVFMGTLAATVFLAVDGAATRFAPRSADPRAPARPPTR